MPSLMRLSKCLILLVCISLHARPTTAQQNTTTSIVDSNAVCSQADQDSIQTCIRQVEADELRLHGKVCTPPQWQCICEKQQGLLDCYTFCLGTVPVDLLSFISKECAGAHKAATKIRSQGGKVPYAWSTLPVPPGAMTPIEVKNPTANTPTSDSTDSSKAESDIKGAPSFVGFTDSTSHAINAADTFPVIKPFVEVVSVFAFLWNIL